MASFKTLMILRHAQAVPSNNAGDTGRRLSPQGVQEAAALGKAMKEKSHIPDLALCSTAMRTRQTLEGVAEALPGIETRYDENIYNADYERLLSILRQAPDHAAAVLIVGHNPAIHMLAASLATDDGSPNASRLASSYPPGSLTVLQCACAQWQDLMPGENSLKDLLTAPDFQS